MRIHDASLQYRNCTFVENRSRSGAAIVVNGTIASTAASVFTDCQFKANSANNVGGSLLLAGTGQAFLERCQFVDNRASSSGGVAFIWGTVSHQYYYMKCNYFTHEIF